MTPNSSAKSGSHGAVVRAGNGEVMSRGSSFVHPSFVEAQNRGAEPAVLHFMGECMVMEFMLHCRTHNVDALKLSNEDLKDGMDATLKGMVDPSRPQFATTSFQGFRALYRNTRENFKGIALKAAESQTERLISTLHAVESSSLLKPAERAKMEGQIVKQAVVAGSSFRTAGRTPRHVVAMFRDNTDVSKSPLVGIIEQAIESDAKAIQVRRANAARDHVLPKPSAPSPFQASGLTPARA